MVHIVAFTKKFLVEIIFSMDVLYKPFIQGGSRSSQVMVSLGIKFVAIFKIVELKAET